MVTDENTPRKRVIDALHGERAGRVPFTVYENKMPRCTRERLLRNRGLCIVYRAKSLKIYHPNVEIREEAYVDEAGRHLIKKHYITPYKELTSVTQPAQGTVWTHEYMFKSADDYKALCHIAGNIILEPDYGSVSRLASELGGDYIVRDSFPVCPMDMIISTYMGTNTFCYEWMDNRDELLKLYRELREAARRSYPLIADSPLEHANYGGNVVPQLIGVENFREYYLSNYNEASEYMHRKGKLIGVHLDGDNTLIMDEIAGSGLDYIEAYDAGISPSVKTARNIFKNKVLWINWPSAWHFLDRDEVKGKTVELLREAEPLHGFIVGITEDVPEDRWFDNYSAIMDGIDEYETAKQYGK